jgi:hypothetical protein
MICGQVIISCFVLKLIELGYKYMQNKQTSKKACSKNHMNELSMEKC